MAGLLLTASLPPFGWWPLGMVGAAVLAWLVEGGGWRTRLVLGLAVGVVLYAPGLWWVTEFHAVGWVAIVVLESVLLAGAVALVPPRAVVLGLPAALVLGEAVRGRWPFGGLPLAGIDLGQVGGPLLPAARLGGHLLLVGLVGLTGVGLAALARRRRAVAATCLGLTAVTAVAGVAAFAGTDRGLLNVAAVQGGGPRGFRAVDTDPDTVFAAQVAATGEVPPGTGLVVWPENVIDLSRPLAGSNEEAVVADLARGLGTTIVAGVTEEIPGQDRFRNAAVVWGPDGRVVDRFEKVHRVPFGEYIPFRALVEDVADVSAVPRDAIPGKGPGVLDSPAGRLAVVVSYEVFFADRARSGVRAGGRVLLVPTNAASYTTSQVPTQEVAVAQLRAVETGRWVVQAAPTGYSAVVDPDGRVRVRGPLGDASVPRHGVQLRSGETLATRLGDAPIVGLAAVFLACAWIRNRKLESLGRKFLDA